jgi:hypothetical protein
VPAGVGISLAVALGNSTSVSDALVTIPVQFEAGKTYVAIATGIVNGTPGFAIDVFDMGLETTTNASDVGILFYHGSPDAPTVDVVTGGNVLIDNASYGDFAGYLQVPASTYILQVTPGNDNSTVVASYEADLSFWSGRTAVIFASGFLTSGQPAFEPWVALSNGGTFPLPLFVNRLQTSTETSLTAQAAPVRDARLYPNPTFGRVQLDLQLEAETEVQTLLVDQQGRIVAERNAGILSAGAHQVTHRFDNVPTGQYFLLVRTAGGVQTLPLRLERP